MAEVRLTTIAGATNGEWYIKRPFTGTGVGYSSGLDVEGEGMARGAAMRWRPLFARDGAARESARSNSVVAGLQMSFERAVGGMRRGEDRRSGSSRHRGRWRARGWNWHPGERLKQGQVSRQRAAQDGGRSTRAEQRRAPEVGAGQRGRAAWGGGGGGGVRGCCCGGLGRAVVVRCCGAVEVLAAGAGAAGLQARSALSRLQQPKLKDDDPHLSALLSASSQCSSESRACC
ncbi:hypothetical protein BDV95DRAFT_296725 [Massariosphaeria phaeospora]|uniref:Uncharacterized protein n=1 Tax=Massariosphaeria phaeospora TaxID=100035 RepID=A0A7C8MEJ2_9PLEO|nr:hypothetical protein BDV95DRAFT_296725 [Massariosphaeria phaeospora]